MMVHALVLVISSQLMKVINAQLTLKGSVLFLTVEELGKFFLHHPSLVIHLVGPTVLEPANNRRISRTGGTFQEVVQS
jgi:hypothetical protein